MVLLSSLGWRALGYGRVTEAAGAKHPVIQVLSETGYWMPPEGWSYKRFVLFRQVNPGWTINYEVSVRKGALWGEFQEAI